MSTKSTVSINPSEQDRQTILIREREIPVTTQFMETSKLLFYVDNPRIYSVIRGGASQPSQKDIERELLKLDHVKQLIQDIRTNGGLIDPVIVKAGTLEVLEGNSRLAAYRALADRDPVKWAFMKCTVLPTDIEESVVFALLGQYHIKGKKDWAPFEQAGFLYRRFKNHKIDKHKLAEEIGLSPRKVQHLIDTYQFMINNNDDDTGHWSFYDEYLKSNKIQTVRDRFDGFDQVIVDKIRSGEIERAVDLRDRLPVICSAPEKILKKFVKGERTFQDSFDDADEAGSNSTVYKRLERFRLWLAGADIESAVRNGNKPSGDRIIFEINKIHQRIQTLYKKLKSDT